MTAGLQLASRGFIIVYLTAANVYQMAHEHWIGMFVCGALISIVWWDNAKTSARSTVPYARGWYGLGAGLGTVAGVASMAWWYG